MDRNGQAVRVPADARAPQERQRRVRVAPRRGAEQLCIVADESFRDRVNLAVAVDDAVRREDLGGTWRALERAMGHKTWRWATGSAGELAVARLHEMVCRIDEGAGDVRGRNALTARDCG